jgi:hypothetical protein
MSAWRVELERRLALVVGECFHEQRMGWRTPFFLPADSFGVIVNGPRFKPVDDLAALSAIRDIERRVGRAFADDFWDHASQQSLQEVVSEMLQRGAAA